LHRGVDARLVAVRGQHHRPGDRTGPGPESGRNAGPTEHRSAGERLRTKPAARIDTAELADGVEAADRQRIQRPLDQPAALAVGAGIGAEDAAPERDDSIDEENAMPLLTEGSPAPAFSVPNQDGATVSLDQFAGKWLVLWWYPKADTPG